MKSGATVTPESDQEAKPDESLKSSSSDVKIEKPLPEGWFSTYGADFVVGPKEKPRVVRSDVKSLYLFSSSMSFRMWCVQLTEMEVFDRFIMLVIILNSILLCLSDNNDRIYGDQYHSRLNEELLKVDTAFTIIFILECTIKIIAKGFLFHRESYLRDAWNWLDFFVVILSIVNFLPNIDSGGLKGLRTFRILRPLRTINRMPQMKQLIQTLFVSCQGLLGIFFFLSFTFVFFSIFGVQSFQGSQYNFCRVIEKPVVKYDETGKLIYYDWPIVSTFPWNCQSDQHCEKLISIFGPDPESMFPPVFKCGNSLSFKIKAGGDFDIDGVKRNPHLLYDFINYNNIGNGLLTTFQVLTLETWTEGVMYNYMDAKNTYVAAFFFVTMVVLGGFFLMNLVLAQIINSFNEQGKQQANTELSNALIHKLTLPLAGALKLKKKESQDARISKIKKKSIIRSQSVILAEANQSESPSKVPELDESAVVDETLMERDTRKRSHSNFIYRFFFKLVTHWMFNFFVVMLILLNTISLAAETFDQSQDKEYFLDVCNIVFTWAFTCEMVFKLIGLGPKAYMHESYNTFDAIIVILSLIDFAINKTLGDSASQGTEVLKTFRALRLLRIIKITRRWETLQIILKKMMMSLSGVYVFGILLFLFLYIFALLGMQLFAKQSYYDSDGVMVSGDLLVQRYATETLKPVRTSFDNIGLAMNTIYLITMTDKWNFIMYNHLLPTGETWPGYSIFFVIVQAFGSKVMLALFTAILLENFTSDTDASELETSLDKSDSLSNKSFKRPIFQLRFTKEGLDQFYYDLKDAFGHRKTIQETPQKKISNLVKVMDPMPALSPIKVRQVSRLHSTKEISNSAEQYPTARLKARVSDQDLADRAFFDVAEAEIDAESEGSKKAQKSEATKKKSLQFTSHTAFLHYAKLEKDNVIEVETGGVSLYLFSRTNPIRKICLQISGNRTYFETFILICILISTISLAVESPVNDPESTKLAVLQRIDIAMTAIFTIEMSLKIVAYGLLFNGPNSYLRVIWNCLDCFIVVSSLASLSPSINLSILKTFRIVRILRPLRMVSRNKGLKIALMALIGSIPDIANLLIIVLLFNFLFGILHTTLFGGLFWSCHFDHLNSNGSLSFEQTSELIRTKWDCINFGGEWTNADFNFDNIWSSMLVLFGIQTKEGWYNPVMWAQTDGTQVDHMPVELAKPYYIVFAIFVNIIMNLLFLQLFVGVVVETFKEQKEQLLGKKLLTKRRLNFVNMQIMGYEAKPVYKVVPQKDWSSLRLKTFKLITHPQWEPFIQSLVMLNTIILCITWYAQNKATSEVLRGINYAFIAIGCTTVSMGLYAFRWHFFRVGWRNLDLIVASLSVLLLILQYYNLGNFAVQSTIIRSFRLARLFRALRSTKTLQIILSTLEEGLTSMSSLGSLLLLIMFMFAIIGMRLFGLANVTNQSQLHYHCNFKQFGNAFLTLIRSATGENWNFIMYDLARQKSILFQCVDSQEYSDLAAANMVTNKCGTPASYPYFIIYIIVINQIFLNLFIAIIVESFVSQTQSLDLPIQYIDVEIFVESWKDFDNEAKGFICAHQIQGFLQKMIDKKSTLLPKELLDRTVTPEMSKEDRKEIERSKYRYLNRLNCMIYNNWEAATRADIPSVVFIDFLQAMIRERYRLALLEERAQAEIKRKQLEDLMATGGHDDKDHNFMADALYLNPIDEDLHMDWDQFIETMDYKSKKIELMIDLRKQAATQRIQIKQFTKQKSHPARQKQLENEYNWYVEWHNKHAERLQALEDDSQSVNDGDSEFTKPPMTKEVFEKEIFDKEITTLHYFVFCKVAREWKNNVFLRTMFKLRRLENKSKKVRKLEIKLRTANDNASESQNAGSDEAKAVGFDKIQQLQ